MLDVVAVTGEVDKVEVGCFMAEVERDTVGGVVVVVGWGAKEAMKSVQTLINFPVAGIRHPNQ